MYYFVNGGLLVAKKLNPTETGSLLKTKWSPQQRMSLNHNKTWYRMTARYLLNGLVYIIKKGVNTNEGLRFVINGRNSICLKHIGKTTITSISLKDFLGVHIRILKSYTLMKRKKINKVGIAFWRHFSCMHCNHNKWCLLGRTCNLLTKSQYLYKF